MYAIKKEINKTNLFKNKSFLLGRLDIELTERCNNNCIHCYINQPEKDIDIKKRELSTERIKELLKEAADLGCLKVRFTGGEPLLREDFEDIYVFARRLGLKVIIFTNATLITLHLVELFAEIPPLEKIEVTVYGMNKDSYEKATRNPGSFEAAFRGIDLLLERNIPFIVKYAILPSNINEIDEFDKWAAKIPWMKRKASYVIFFDLRCRPDSTKNESIKKIRLLPEAGLEILKRRKEEYIKEMRQFASKFMRPPGNKIFSCGAGIGGGCVDAYGNLQMCMLLRHPGTIYDLNDGSLKDALVRFFPELRQIQTSNPDYLSRCAQCFLKGLCEQCPAKSWMEHGSLDDVVEYHCEIAHAKARFFGLLEEGEAAWKVKDWEERLKRFTNEPVLVEK